MIVILSSIGLFSVFLAIFIIKSDGYDAEGWGLLALLFGVIMVGALVAWPISVATENANIARFHSLEQTLADARANTEVSEYEIAAIMTTVAEMNKDLATKQYWARLKLSNWFYPKELLTLEPIK